MFIENLFLCPFQIMIQGMVPLCSWQYERLFNTVRVPGIETDRIVHYQVRKQRGFLGGSFLNSLSSFPF